MEDKNMKKILKIMILPLFLVCSLFGLVACGENSEQTPPVDSISLYATFKTEYFVGETLNVAGGILNYTHDGKTVQVVISNDMISGFDSEVVGTREMVLTYQENTLSISYTIKAIPNNPIDFMGDYRSKELVANTGSDGNSSNYSFAHFRGDKLYVYWAQSPNLEEEMSRPGQAHYSFTSNFLNGEWIIMSEAKYGSVITIKNITNQGFDLYSYETTGTLLHQLEMIKI